MWYTGLDPRTMKPVFVPKTPHDKALQRALMQWRKPQNRKLVLEALHKTGREDLIGYGKRCLIRPDKGGAPHGGEGGGRPDRSAPRKFGGSRATRSEKSEASRRSGPAKRKAGWAKPAAPKKGTKGRKRG